MTETSDIYYSGVGGRILPEGMYERLYTVGQTLATLGLVLRSGAADGSDTAFEHGCDAVGGKKEIYLPWKNFKDHDSHLWQIPDEAYEIAEQHYHSNWKAAKWTTKSFMARDCQQVTGETLDVPVDFVVCYTRDGCENAKSRTKTTGGTGQAIGYASSLEIPVFNLHNEWREEQLLEFIERYAK